MFWRLFGTYGLLLLVALGLVGALVVDRVERQALKQIEESLHTRALFVLEILRDHPPGGAQAQEQRFAELGREIQTRVTLIDDDGRVLVDSDKDPESMENHGGRPEILAARETGYGSSQRFSGTPHQPMMYVAIRGDDRPGGAAFVRVALPLTGVRERLAELSRLVWTAAGVTALAALALAFGLARWGARPLRELTRGADRIAAGSFGHKVFEGGRDEVGQLSRAFNAMSERLARQFAQLEADRQQLRAVLSGMVEGVVAVDAEQRVLFSNDRAGRLLGFDSKAAVGRKLWKLVRRRPIQEIARRALASPEPCSEELTWKGPETTSIAVHAAPLPGIPAPGAVLVLHDISELRRLEQVRRDFVANVSHELKTPLAVITACVETLLDGAAEDPQDRTTFLQQVAEQAERLHLLILDLLSLARIEAGAEVFDFQEISVAAAVAACLERHRARAEANQQSLEAAAEAKGGSPGADGPGLPTAARTPPADESVWADEEALGEILDNLVDNGLKYTPAGGRIRVGWFPDGDQVCVEVADTGIGIPERDLPRIFERFYRVNKARSRELGGTGLGLSIVKHLVQAMRGTVRATSTVGQGTTFRVCLPRPPKS